MCGECSSATCSNQFPHAPLHPFPHTVFRCSGADCLRYKTIQFDSILCIYLHSFFLLLNIFRLVFQFVRYYNIREYLLKDLMAGISVGVLHIPQALAFGLLASLKIQDGFFTSIYPVIMYLLFGTSPHVSFGTSAVICILVAGTVDR